MESGVRSIVMVKLGGSLLTDKRRPGAARSDVIERVAGEVATSLSGLETDLLLGHGSGSFGHAAAARHGLGRSRVAAGGRAGVAEVQGRAAALHGRVATALREAGVPVFSFAPSSLVVAEGGRPVSLPAEALSRALELGLVPLLYGDIVMDRELGAAVLSTEQLLEATGEALEGWGWRVREALWLGVTDGIYGADGATLPVVRADAPEAGLEAAGEAAGVDVTGGMAHRLEVALRLARRGVPSWIGDGREPGALLGALRGETSSGTRVLPASSPPGVPGADAGR